MLFIEITIDVEQLMSAGKVILWMYVLGCLINYHFELKHHKNEISALWELMYDMKERLRKLEGKKKSKKK